MGGGWGVCIGMSKYKTLVVQHPGCNHNMTVNNLYRTKASKRGPTWENYNVASLLTKHSIC